MDSLLGAELRFPIAHLGYASALIKAKSPELFLIFFIPFRLFPLSPFSPKVLRFFMRLGFYLSITGSLRRAVYQNGA
jgi:hypothetical protein